MPKKPTLIKPINTSFEKLTKVVATSNNSEKKQEIQTINYEKYDFSFDEESQTIWGTQEQIASVFQVDRTTITKHIKNIIKVGELEEKSNVQKIHITNSDKPVKLYNLDFILSVGYRVNSKKATQFRKWATNVLSQYLKDGYVIDEKRLRQDPSTLNKIAAEIRALRAEEKNIYHSVRECFKISSSDYNPKSKEVINFYATLQDKFHHAITKMTASKLIMDRADHTKEKMGIQSSERELPTEKEAKTGKSYLVPDEIYRMHLLSEQFLLYAESTALMNKKMTMAQLHRQLDNLLKLNGYPVFDGYIDNLRPDAMHHAEREFRNYEKIQKLKLSGIKVDLQEFYDGYYDERYEALELGRRRLSTLKKRFEEKKQKQLENKSEKLNQIKK